MIGPKKRSRDQRTVRTPMMETSLNRHARPRAAWLDRLIGIGLVAVLLVVLLWMRCCTLRQGGLVGASTPRSGKM